MPYQFAESRSPNRVTFDRRSGHNAKANSPRSNNRRCWTTLIAAYWVIATCLPHAIGQNPGTQSGFGNKSSNVRPASAGLPASVTAPTNQRADWFEKLSPEQKREFASLPPVCLTADTWIPPQQMMGPQSATPPRMPAAVNNYAAMQRLPLPTARPNSVPAQGTLRPDTVRQFATNPSAALANAPTATAAAPQVTATLPQANPWTNTLGLPRTVVGSNASSPQNGNHFLNPHANASRDLAEARLASARNAAKKSDGEESPDAANADPHAEVFSKTCYPSALECRKCHEQIYEEWAISSHANAAVSPMFHKFEQKAHDLTRGTLGTFCVRCHSPVGTTEGYPRHASIFDAPRVYREGVTCVACHRVAEEYSKMNGERRMEPGPVEAPVYGSGDGLGAEMALRYKDHFKVKTDPREPGPGNVIHRRAIKFQQLSESTFCASCHQVAVQPGIKLEVVWDQYRGSPACRQGIRCQDCHMGKVPGMAEGFSIGPVAIISGKSVGPERRHSNHVFYGPGNSIAHPGIYPMSKENEKFPPRRWLTFDWRAGWGTDAFEKQIEGLGGAFAFPPEWQNVDDRYDARDIITANLKKLAYKKDLRRQVMENGSRIDGPCFDCGTRFPNQTVMRTGEELRFHYKLTNTNSGHNTPSGSLGAQPQLWLNVRLTGPDGEGLWESGYLDSNGDMCDIHSLDVRAGKAPFDSQLLNLQTKFLISNIKGTDREMYLPFNIDIDQLPFARPPPQPTTVINHPPFVRMEAHSLAPLETRKVPYTVPGHLLSRPGTYRLSVRLRMRSEPIYFMIFCGATPEMIRSMNEQILDVHPYTVAFEVR